MKIARAVALCCCLALVPALALGQQDLARKLDLLKAYPDLIVVNAKIVTMNDRNPVAQAMAVKNTRILAIGTNEEIRFLAGPQTTVMDMKGRNVLPGLIDPHQHAHLWLINHWFGAEGDFAAKKYNDPQLQIFFAKGQDQASVLKELEKTVHERAATLGPGKWIWVGLFSGNSLGDSRKVVWPMIQKGTDVLTRQYLDTLAPNNPLIVMSTECCLGTHNTKAAEQMKKILGHESDSRTELTYELLLRGRADVKADLVKQELTQSIAPLGVTTTASNYWGSPSIMKSYNLLYERGQLPVRWAWYFDTPGGDEAIPFFRNLGDFRGIGNDYIWNAGVSDEGWESGLECTTSKPIKPLPTSHDVQNPHTVERSCSNPIDYEKVKGYRDVRAGLEDGLRITFLHTYSEGGYEALFHLLNQEIDDGKITLDDVRQLRLGAEHNPLIRPDFIESIKKFGIVPSLTSHTMQGDTRGGLYLQEFGFQEHLTWLQPVKSLVDAGMHPVLATDSNLGAVPVYAQDMDYPREWNGNLWAFLEFFVTRTMPNTGVVYNRDQAVDKMTMLKLTTIWAAESILNDKNIGSLETGKLADFIVIDKDFASVPNDQIHNIKTLLTVVGGKTTYKAPNY